MSDLFKDFKNIVESTEFPEKRIDRAIKAAIKEANLKKRNVKRLKYLSSIAAVFAFILFGSAFFSPALANTLSRTPIIGPIFKIRHPSDLILQALEKKGYKTDSIIFQFQPDKVVEIYIDGKDTYIQEIKDDVKTIVEDVLQSQGYDAYSVKVKKVEPMDAPEVTENHSEMVGEVVSLEKLPEYKQKWVSSGVITAVNNELFGRKDYHIEEIAISMADGSMNWNITLSLLAYNDPSTIEVANGIRKNMITILESDSFKDKIDGLPYYIKISDKDDKIIIE